MTFQKRLLRVMRRHNMRVADLARHLETPYTTVREWVLHGRVPLEKSSTAEESQRWINQKLKVLEK